MTASRLGLPLVAWLLAASLAAAADAPPVSFSRDIRPLLASRCYACHGPDAAERKADLRLDDGEAAHASGVIKPGEAAASELLARVTSTDDETKMPPAASKKPALSPAEIDLVRRWIDQGAKYDAHWAYQRPVRPALPAVKNAAWPATPVDRFLLAELERQGLAPSADADKRTLLRRLSFDVIGLPPTPAEMDAFLADASPQALERAIDRLLASEHYGERMATYWLDVVRYADSAGYHSDNHRDVWAYRDYVIRAFNRNKPFDRFTQEQLAGDLLPDATGESRIASGYNRLLQTTEEGGAQAKEYAAKYSADRVRNTATIWLATTMGCCECHNHKFDPFTQRDFYRLAAFFADVAEKPVGRQEQTRVPWPEQEVELKRLDELLARAQAQLDAPHPGLAAGQAKWEAEARETLAQAKNIWTPLAPEKLESQGGQTLSLLDDQSILAGGEQNPAQDVYTLTFPAEAGAITGLRLEALLHESLGKGLSRGNGNFVLTGVEVELLPAQGKGKPVALAEAEADFSQDGYPIEHALDNKPATGWAVNGHQSPAPHAAAFVLAAPVAGAPGQKLVVRLKHQSTFPKHHLGRFRLSATSAEEPTLSGVALPASVAQALATPAAERTPPQAAALARHYRTLAPELAPARAEVARLAADRKQLVDAFPSTLVSMPVAPRTVRILPRGNWLDDSGEIVTSSPPASLFKGDAESQRLTRLDFARWLTAPENPLTARVFVNRLWKLCFGRGIVKSLDDFGLQGELPSHPELLDWLAVDFVESGWDVKRLHKLLLMSRAYRQTSVVSPKLKERDPLNLFLARQNRFRIEAEFVRDNALAVSGLLARQIGGPSVKPYQPAGYWQYLNFPKREWQADKGEALYRRGLYTYWQRTFLHPMMLAFDAPSREECTVDRPKSNTPQQALVLLNDPSFVEAARVLAGRIVEQGGSSLESRLEFAFRQVLQRRPTAAERELLAPLIDKHRREFAAEASAAQQLTSVGAAPAAEGMDPAELAAWTSLARVLLNLHETTARN